MKGRWVDEVKPEGFLRMESYKHNPQLTPNAKKLRKEMTEEEAAQFTAEHQAKIQNTLKISYLVRTFTMLATLVIAFLIKHFAVVATVIPLLLYKPINMVAALVKRKVVKDV